MTVRKTTKLERALKSLEGLYGKPAAFPPRNALEWIVWENVAYLADDDRRAAAYQRLEKTVGITAAKLANAPHEKLLAATKLGGIHAELRARRLTEIGDLAGEHDLGAVSKLDAKAARRVLKKFPAIGDPGAEKILLFLGHTPALALESNGLRVLLRLGYGIEAKSYAASYRSVQDAARKELREDCHAYVRAHELLRTHGRTLCKRTSPLCDECPLVRDCRFASRTEL